MQSYIMFPKGNLRKNSQRISRYLSNRCICGAVGGFWVTMGMLLKPDIKQTVSVRAGCCCLGTLKLDNRVGA